MTRHGKIVLAVLVVGSALGLIAATNAWFVAVSNTPPGAINSALVRWLPEAGERSFTSILKYGNLISGSGVDPDGVPLVLPGNPLLANVTTNSSSQTVRTSIARTFDDGPNHTAPETADTVIHWEIREYARADGSMAELAKKQRDVMDAHEPKDQWFYLSDPNTPIEDPTPNASDYNVTTTTSGGVGVPGTNPGGVPTTTTTTEVTTTYTALKEGAFSYLHVVATTRVVTHEAATITPVSDASRWEDATPVLTALETVLWVRDLKKPELADLPTRSYLIITPMRTVNSTVIPLTLGNLSNVESNLRIGITGRLTDAAGKITSLTLTAPSPQDSNSDGSYFLGTTTADGTFIELIQFRPYTAEGQYKWVKVNEQAAGKGSLWSLWDLTVNNKTAVPSISTADTGTSSSSSPPAADAPTAPLVEPTLYTVTNMLRIVPKRPDVNTAVDDTTFEQLFNQLYCDKVPTITLHLSYYVRQSEFMEWTEFYSQNIDLSMPN